MGTLLIIALTIFIIAIAAGGFFYSAYHTMHFDLPNMFIGAVVFLVAAAILFAVLGFVIPALTVALLV